MGAQRLAGNLHQTGPERGLAQVFPAGTLRSDLPKWVRVDDGAFVDSDDAPSSTPTELVEPPRDGRGSGKQAWIDFAAAHGVAASKRQTRDEIVQVLVEAGVVEAS